MSSLEQEGETTTQVAKESAAVGSSGWWGWSRSSGAGSGTTGWPGRSLGSMGMMVGVANGLNLVQADRVQLDGLVTLLNLLSDVNVVLGLDQVHQLIRVLADNDGAVVTGHVVPGNALVVLVIHDSQTGLVVVLLQPLNGHANVKLSLNGALGQAFSIVRLSNAIPRQGKEGKWKWKRDEEKAELTLRWDSKRPLH